MRRKAERGDGGKQRLRCVSHIHCVDAYAAAHSAPRRPVAFASARTPCVSTCKDTVCASSGAMLSQSGESRNPTTVTPEGTIGWM